jgi:hypothetical protein
MKEVCFSETLVTGCHTATLFVTDNLLYFRTILFTKLLICFHIQFRISSYRVQIVYSVGIRTESPMNDSMHESKFDFNAIQYRGIAHAVILPLMTIKAWLKSCDVKFVMDKGAGCSLDSSVAPTICHSSAAAYSSQIKGLPQLPSLDIHSKEFCLISSLTNGAEVI